MSEPNWDAYHVQLASDAIRPGTRLMEAVDRESLADDLARIAARLRTPSEPVSREAEKCADVLVGYALGDELALVATPSTISMRVKVYPPQHAPAMSLALYVRTPEPVTPLSEQETS